VFASISSKNYGYKFVIVIISQNQEIAGTGDQFHQPEDSTLTSHYLVSDIGSNALMFSETRGGSTAPINTTNISEEITDGLCDMNSRKCDRKFSILIGEFT
jgi:hypothetical protein